MSGILIPPPAGTEYYNPVGAVSETKLKFEAVTSNDVDHAEVYESHREPEAEFLIPSCVFMSPFFSFWAFWALGAADF